jgi:hypothetical protein
MRKKRGNKPERKKKGQAGERGIHRRGHLVSNLPGVIGCLARNPQANTRSFRAGRHG